MNSENPFLTPSTGVTGAAAPAVTPASTTNPLPNLEGLNIALLQALLQQNNQTPSSLTPCFPSPQVCSFFNPFAQNMMKPASTFISATSDGSNNINQMNAAAAAAAAATHANNQFVVQQTLQQMGGFYGTPNNAMLYPMTTNATTAPTNGLTANYLNSFTPITTTTTTINGAVAHNNNNNNVLQNPQNNNNNPSQYQENQNSSNNAINSNISGNNTTTATYKQFLKSNNAKNSKSIDNNHNTNLNHSPNSLVPVGLSSSILTSNHNGGNNSSSIPSTKSVSSFVQHNPTLSNSTAKFINNGVVVSSSNKKSKIIVKHADIIKKKRQIKIWTIEEDDLLKRLCEMLPGKWNEIAVQIPGRNASQCSQRWRRILPTKVRKPWTNDEDIKVIELSEKYGKNWGMIAQHIEGKTGKQVRERYINKLDPHIKRTPWTEAEDQKILDMFLDQGPKWSAISNELVGRPENTVKNRFYSHISRIYLSDDTAYQAHKNSDNNQKIKDACAKIPHQSASLAAAAAASSSSGTQDSKKSSIASQLVLQAKQNHPECLEEEIDEEEIDAVDEEEEDDNEEELEEEAEEEDEVENQNDDQEIELNKNEIIQEEVEDNIEREQTHNQNKKNNTAPKTNLFSSINPEQAIAAAAPPVPTVKGKSLQNRSQQSSRICSRSSSSSNNISSNSLKDNHNNNNNSKNSSKNSQNKCVTNNSQPGFRQSLLGTISSSFQPVNPTLHNNSSSNSSSGVSKRVLKVEEYEDRDEEACAIIMDAVQEQQQQRSPENQVLNNNPMLAKRGKIIKNIEIPKAKPSPILAPIPVAQSTFPAAPSNTSNNNNNMNNLVSNNLTTTTVGTHSESEINSSLFGSSHPQSQLNNLLSMNNFDFLAAAAAAAASVQTPSSFYNVGLFGHQPSNSMTPLYSTIPNNSLNQFQTQQQQQSQQQTQQPQSLSYIAESSPSPMFINSINSPAAMVAAAAAAQLRQQATQSTSSLPLFKPPMSSIGNTTPSAITPLMLPNNAFNSYFMYAPQQQQQQQPSLNVLTPGAFSTNGFNPMFSTAFSSYIKSPGLNSSTSVFPSLMKINQPNSTYNDIDNNPAGTVVNQEDLNISQQQHQQLEPTQNSSVVVAATGREQKRDDMNSMQSEEAEIVVNQNSDGIAEQQHQQQQSQKYENKLQQSQVNQQAAAAGGGGVEQEKSMQQLISQSGVNHLPNNNNNNNNFSLESLFKNFESLDSSAQKMFQLMIAGETSQQQQQYPMNQENNNIKSTIAVQSDSSIEEVKDMTPLNSSQQLQEKNQQQQLTINPIDELVIAAAAAVQTATSTYSHPPLQQNDQEMSE